MLERNIMIVDDDDKTESIHIPSYKRKLDELKKQSEKWHHHIFNLFHMISMGDALEFLAQSGNYVDVLLVDYKFLNVNTFVNGADFVKHIRDNVNRQCQIVFYTMHGVDSIPNTELVSLINSNVFMFVDKSANTNVVAQAIFDACTLGNPVVESLERFYQKYKIMLEAKRYTLADEDASFEDIINHIRMDDEIGRSFVEKLLQKAILLETDLKD